MKKEYFIAGFTLLFLISTVLIFFYSKSSDQSEKEISNPQSMKTEELESEDKLNKENEDSEKGVEEGGNYDGNVNEEFQAEEKGDEDEAEQEKIELMDYVELTMEEFMEETELRLHQDEENEDIWRTSDNVIRVRVDNGNIVGLGIDKVLCDEEPTEIIEKEGFPYTLAGISLNDEVSRIEETILKDACHDDGMLNEEFYSSLYLSKLGIESLHLVHDGGRIGMVSAGYDQSLKENAEHLEYVWSDRIRQKEGIRNDKLEVVQEPFVSLPNRYRNLENIEKTVVWIKYPCLEIPGEPEMTKNANEVILEAVNKIEDNTYGKTDKNIVVTADYIIDYISGEFISISFEIYVYENGADSQ